MDKSFENMYRCLSYHPAISDKVRHGECIKIFIGSDTEHSDIAQKMHGYEKDFNVKSDFAFLEETSADDIKQKNIRLRFIYLSLRIINIKERISTRARIFNQNKKIYY
ncbi:hypothetical protein [Photorhabdus temperata]|uniref:hypothetical protein n=1 Tax=Photorhabdus temperata TaxID=574560 RepID=UPI00040FB3BF|nr:hypothetical protein [Photorhabdus temperata]